MGYVIIGALLIVALMPFSIRNQTRYRQERIKKKAALYGIDLSLEDNKK